MAMQDNQIIENLGFKASKTLSGIETPPLEIATKLVNLLQSL